MPLLLVLLAMPSLALFRLVVAFLSCFLGTAWLLPPSLSLSASCSSCVRSSLLFTDFFAAAHARPRWSWHPLFLWSRRAIACLLGLTLSPPSGCGRRLYNVLRCTHRRPLSPPPPLQYSAVHPVLSGFLTIPVALHVPLPFVVMCFKWLLVCLPPVLAHFHPVRGRLLVVSVLLAPRSMPRSPFCFLSVAPWHPPHASFELLAWPF